MLVVSVERNRHLQSHQSQTHAELVLPSQAPREQSLQKLWKEYDAHDTDHNVIGRRREEAGKITVVRVEGPWHIADLTLDTALGCGFKTTQALRDAWAAQHPRSFEVKVVWFAIGDWRDRDRYLAWTGVRAGSDERGYTLSRARAMDADAPVPEEIVELYAATNRQKDEARRAKASAALETETPSERLQRLLRYIEHVRDTVGEEAARAVYISIRQHLRVIEQRVRRSEGRKEEDPS